MAAHVGRANIDLIGSAATVLAMMLYGAAGFYLGIDLPPAPPDHKMHLPLRHRLGSAWDTVELLSAAGTFRHRGLGAIGAVVDTMFSKMSPLDKSRVIRALRMLENKVDTMPRKKHGNIPL